MGRNVPTLVTAERLYDHMIIISQCFYTLVTIMYPSWVYIRRDSPRTRTLAPDLNFPTTGTCLQTAATQTSHP